MKSIEKITGIGMPAVIGLGIAFIGLRLIQNEQKIATRKIELELQLSAKSLSVL